MLHMKQTAVTCSGHTRPVVDLAFSGITEKGYFLVSACKDGNPMLRQGETGDWIGTFKGHKGAVWGTTISQDARTVATGAADFSVKIWNGITGEEQFSIAHNHIVKSVAFSHSQTERMHLLTGANDKTCRIFDVANQTEEALITFTGHEGSVKTAVWSSDDKTVFSVSDDKTLRVWDTTSGECRKKIDLSLPAADIQVCTIDNKECLVMTSGQVVSFWDASSLERLKEFPGSCDLYSAALSSDGSTFVCGGQDNSVYKYDFATGAELECSKGHFGPIHCVRYSPDGEVFATGSEDGTLRLWQQNVGQTYGLWRCAADTATSATPAIGTAIEIEVV